MTPNFLFAQILSQARLFIGLVNYNAPHPPRVYYKKKTDSGTYIEAVG